MMHGVAAHLEGVLGSPDDFRQWTVALLDYHAEAALKRRGQRRSRRYCRTCGASAAVLRKAQARVLQRAHPRRGRSRI